MPLGVSRGMALMLELQVPYMPDWTRPCKRRTARAYPPYTKLPLPTSEDHFCSS
jgi:hypothetical protein